MRKISNPTESAAIGLVDKELNRARDAARRLIEARRIHGDLRLVASLEARKQFVGLARCVFVQELRRLAQSPNDADS